MCARLMRATHARHPTLDTMETRPEEITVMKSVEMGSSMETNGGCTYMPTNATTRLRSLETVAVTSVVKNRAGGAKEGPLLFQMSALQFAVIAESSSRERNAKMRTSKTVMVVPISAKSSPDGTAKTVLMM